MNLTHASNLDSYVSPETRVRILDIEHGMLTTSGSQNEDVGGKDDPDNDW